MAAHGVAEVAAAAIPCLPRGLRGPVPAAPPAPAKAVREGSADAAPPRGGGDTTKTAGGLASPIPEATRAEASGAAAVGAPRGSGRRLRRRAAGVVSPGAGSMARRNGVTAAAALLARRRGAKEATAAVTGVCACVCRFARVCVRVCAHVHMFCHSISTERYIGERSSRHQCRINSSLFEKSATVPDLPVPRFALALFSFDVFPGSSGSDQLSDSGRRSKSKSGNGELTRGGHGSLHLRANS